MPDFLAAGENEDVLMLPLPKNTVFGSVCHLLLPENRLVSDRLSVPELHNFKVNKALAARLAPKPKFQALLVEVSDR